MKLDDNYDLTYSNGYYELWSIGVSEKGVPFRRDKKTFANVNYLNKYLIKEGSVVPQAEVNTVANKVFEDYNYEVSVSYLKEKERLARKAAEKGKS